MANEKKVKVGGYELTFRESSAGWNVYAENKEGEGFCNQLVVGAVQQSHGKKTWEITRIGSAYEFKLDGTSLKYGVMFGSREEAGVACYHLYTAWVANPLPENFHLYCQRRLRSIRDEYAALRSRLFDLQIEAKELDGMMRAAGKVEEWQPIEFDVNKELAELQKFLGENSDSLYKHQGKDFARSLLAYVDAVVKAVDPEAATRL